jgi:hypothetical protein
MGESAEFNSWDGERERGMRRVGGKKDQSNTAFFKRHIVRIKAISETRIANKLKTGRWS